MVTITVVCRQSGLVNRMGLARPGPLVAVALLLATFVRAEDRLTTKGKEKLEQAGRVLTSLDRVIMMGRPAWQPSHCHTVVTLSNIQPNCAKHCPEFK